MNKNKGLENKKVFNCVFIVTIIISILFRLVNVFNKRLYYDEISIFVGLTSIFPANWIPHPFLSSIVHKFSYIFLGMNSIPGQRFVSLTIAALNIFIIYNIAREHYNKNIAKFSVLLSLLSFWALFFTTSLDYDGSESLMVSLLMLLCWLNYKKSDWKSKKWGVLFGLMLSIGMLTKKTFLLFFAIYFTDYLLNIILAKKSVWKVKNWTAAIIPFSVGIIGTILAYSLLHPIFPAHIQALIGGPSREIFSLSLNSYFFIYLFLFLTPLLIFIPLAKINKLELKKDSIFIICILFSGLFYYISRFKAGIPAYDRYIIKFMFPSIVLLTSKLTYNGFIKNIKKILTATIGFLVLFNLIFIIYNPEQIAHEPNKLIGSVFNGDFLFPITSNAGPFIQISVYLLIAVYVASFTLLILTYLLKKHKGAFFILLVAISISYNLILMEQYVFKLNYVNADKSMDQAIDFIDSNSLHQLYISNQASFPYVLELHESSIEEFDFKEGSFFSKKINKRMVILSESYAVAPLESKQKGFTYIIFQNLKFGEEQINKIEESCTYNSSFYTNGYESLRIYSC